MDIIKKNRLSPIRMIMLTHESAALAASPTLSPHVKDFNKRIHISHRLKLPQRAVADQDSYALTLKISVLIHYESLAGNRSVVA